MDARPHASPRHGQHVRAQMKSTTVTDRRFMRLWMYVCTIASGTLALLWLLLRSGSKPNRLVYPCQQAALSTAILAFGAPLVSAVIAVRRRLVSGGWTPITVAGAALGLTVTIGVWGYMSRAEVYRGPRLDPPGEYRAQVFHVSDCPQDPVGDHFVGLDNLILEMGHEDLKFYESSTESLISGPTGIVGTDDVVILKINYQWAERGGTNVDLLKGLIRRIVDHPDGFFGEIVVCENAQFASTNGFDRPNNNAQDISMSPHDVVMEYQNQGYTISHFDWTAIRYSSVNEYSRGDMVDGYIVYDYDAVLHGCVSYPKFQSDYGTYISLRDGIWDPDSESYDHEALKFINIPVLKSHHSTYGVTACVKDYMGVVTRELSTNSHGAIHYGILGALQGEIHLADLNLLDCIWINANPNTGPATSYSGATRRDELVASLDPVAADIWAVHNILIPAFIDNGFNPPWPYPSADPDNPNSAFRQYLDNSMFQILASGQDVTNDPAQIDLFTWDGQGNTDCNDNTVPDVWDIEDGYSADDNSNGVPDECECIGDVDQDGQVGVEDLLALLGQWGACSDCGADLDGDGLVNVIDLLELLSRWGACV